jgi:hypothetical protein
LFVELFFLWAFVGLMLLKLFWVFAFFKNLICSLFASQHLIIHTYLPTYMSLQLPLPRRPSPPRILPSFVVFLFSRESSAGAFGFSLPFPFRD